MAAAAAAFTMMTTLIREAADGVHPFEIAFFRALVNLVLMLPFALRTGSAGLKTKNHKAFALRGVCGLAFLMTYFTGEALIPVADSQALTFTSPLWGTLLAVFFLGERLTVTRALAVSVGFAGVLIILRPGVMQVSLGAVLVLAGADCCGEQHDRKIYDSYGPPGRGCFLPDGLRHAVDICSGIIRLDLAGY